MTKDKIIRSTGDVIEVRFVLVDCTRAANAIGQKHGAKGYALQVLGEAIASSLLLAAGLKYKGVVEITYTYSGDLSHVQAAGTPSGHVRAKVSQKEIRKIQNFDLMLSEQHMNVKKLNEKGKIVMDSTVEMLTPKIGQSLSVYMAQSEQTRCAVGIQAECSATEPSLTYCMGFLVELFPKAKDSTITTIEEAIRSLGDLGKFHTPPLGYDLHALLKVLTGGYKYKIHQEIPVTPFCPCSMERVKITLSTLSREEIQSLAAEGGAEVFCDYCRTRYWLTPEDLMKLPRA